MHITSYIYTYIYIYIYTPSPTAPQPFCSFMVIAEGPQGLAGLMDEEERDLEKPGEPSAIMDCRCCGKLNMPRVEWTVHLYTQHN